MVDKAKFSVLKELFASLKFLWQGWRQTVSDNWY